MDKISLAQPDPTPETRSERGHVLAADRFEEIAFSWRRGVWHVPCGSEEGVSYAVVLVPVPRCSCPEYKPGWRCEHIVAAGNVKRATAPCSGCGRRFRHRELAEVTEDHGSLTWFEGDRLCVGCVREHGGIA